MNSAIPIDDSDPRRLVVRGWLSDHPQPTPRDLADAGLVTPHWPAPWGQDAEPMTQLIIEDELLAAGISVPLNPNGILFTGPSLLLGGTPEQQERYLPPMMAGEEMWCRLYSEPDAGSDLAAIRTSAELKDDVYVVNGSKLWAPLAQSAALGGLLVRTSGSPGDLSGLTYLVCPMDLPGITLNPVRDLAGGFRFNELFFDNLEIPLTNRVGEEGEGLDVALARPQFERVSMARGAAFGNGPNALNLLDLVRNGAIPLDEDGRRRLTEAFTESEILRFMAISIAAAREAGRSTSTTERARKILLERHGRSLGFLACDLLGADGTLVQTANSPAIALWYNMFLSGPTITIGAGTTETQLDELAHLLLAG